MEANEIELDEDGVPWASPKIQATYEAALGRFMVAFNRLDNLLTEVLGTVLHKGGRVDLVPACTEGAFWLKLLVADLLKSSIHGGGLKNVPIALMREIAVHRNRVAHGHFDQNPHSGEYDIVGKKREKYSAEDLDLQTAKATEAWEALRYAEGFYAFDDVVVPPS